MLDPRFGEIFARQHNVASRRQCLTILDAGKLGGLVRRGRLEVEHCGVYRPGGSTLSRRGHGMAALLRCGDDAALTGPFVLGLLGVNGFTEEDDFHVLLSAGVRRRGVDFPVRPAPPSLRTMTVDGLRLAVVAHVLIDCGRPDFGVDDDRLFAGYDSARWAGHVSTGRFLEGLAAAGPRDPGAVRWRRMSDERSLRVESPKERELDVVMRRFDPLPELQQWVTPGRRVDFYFRALRLAVEYLGRGSHAHNSGRARDAIRGEELDAAAIRVVYVTAADLNDPAALAAWFVAVTTQRAAELGVAPPTLTTCE